MAWYFIVNRNDHPGAILPFPGPHGKAGGLMHQEGRTRALALRMLIRHTIGSGCSPGSRSLSGERGGIGKMPNEPTPDFQEL
jgi:hypothetical protein